jgi:hypothetical protein
MAVTDSNKSFYEIKEKRLNSSSMLRLFNILRDNDNKTYFINIFRSYDINEDVLNDVLYYSTYAISHEDMFLDNISYDIYGTPYLWWIIALINNIHNPFEELNPGDNIKILRKKFISKILKEIEEIGTF